ncbi:type I secretion system permease/ATPase [Agrobacterium larrymoorei]|uniref:Type I secretion system permease/ATPase n=1 Tax=Agrobacterium larrymoorei TaxID=160699 RepID=A0A4D7DSI5_9HYPH|nr:type I secretion system permease/ATPase [Agrobacterium larrymoorei]QYA08961.1 type I secretion system permease/ATPase [Agrobacterium larrymoorei]
MASWKDERPTTQSLTAAVVSPLKTTFLGLALVSGVVNVLALTSPLFMLQVYDRVLASGSVPTLIGLAVLALGLFAFQCMLDIIRARVLMRIGERFDLRFSKRVHDAVTRLPLISRVSGDGLQPLRDLDNVRGFVSGSGPTAFFDLPWMPFYLGICFLFHFWIGVTALAGAILLVSLTLFTNIFTQKPVREATAENMVRNRLLEASRRNAEVIQAMGMGGRLGSRWQGANQAYLLANRKAGDVAGGLGTVSRTFRIVLQSAILAVGALLVIEQKATGGIMIASSIMMGRALAPVDLAIANWRSFIAARQSWGRLKTLLGQVPALPETLPLPAPERELRVEHVVVAPPGERKPTVTGINFQLAAGSALGVIGPSGSGKSTLSRILTGAWLPIAGQVRLDGATFDQWDREALGQHIGYLPQGVELFEGTIAQNISRFSDEANAEAVISAAKVAGAHELILRFEKGYETDIGEAGSALSAGQRQRIGLARALYGEPFLVVLDEPNANLDADGEAAVIRAIASIRERKGIAIVVAHRPSAIAATDYVLMMEEGRMRAFGPRDDVLSKVLKPAAPAAKAGSYNISAQTLAPLRVVADIGQRSGGMEAVKEDADAKF